MRTDLKPKPKIAATGIAGVLAGGLVVIANALGLDMPPEVATSIVAVAMFAAGYLKKDKKVPA
jgi:hypothetical protein